MAKEKTISISPKHLGALAEPNACTRCWWISHRLKGKLPYQMFPSIFGRLDSYQKSVVSEYLKVHGKAPPWLAPWGEFVAVEPAMHWSKFSIDLEPGIAFRGAPDTMLRRTDNSLFIIDEKTAEPKDGDHKLELMYNVQLNGYARIAERLGMGPISGLGIVYNVPQKLNEPFGLVDVIKGEGYTMYFKPELRQVPRDEGKLDELLALAIRLIKSDQPPSVVPCANCLSIKDLSEYRLSQ